MCVTCYGIFKFLVMSFGMCNAPMRFFTLMKEMLQPFLDKSVVVYLDDIAVYSEMMEDNKKHLAKVLNHCGRTKYT